MLRKNRWFVLILCLVSHAGWALLDTAALFATQQQPLSLRWHQIKDAPAWFSGQPPQYNKVWKLAQVTLAPNESTTVHLAKGQWLRLYHPVTPIDVEQ